MNKTPRIPHLIAGALAASFAVAALLAGGALFWLDGEKDADGYLNTGKHAYTAKTAALTTENLDVDLDGAEWVFDADDDFGKVRLAVESENGKPVFVGVAPTEKVDQYLRGVAHTTMKDVEYDPFDADYRDHAGARRATPPAESRIWTESATVGATGSRELAWDVDEGDWSIVVMNADGSPGIAADVDAGAKLPYLDEIAWSALGTGGFLLLTATGLLVLAFRPRKRGPGLGEPLPAAA
jgi:hypothetical protein